jgi:xanthine dehydrogenase YagS FAD-binding subunit
VIGEDELLTSLRLPATDGGHSVYLKAMDRKAWAFALVAIAARLRLDGARVTDARVVLAGVAPVPWRAPGAERALIGAEMTAAVRERAAAAALAGAEPLRDNGYKVSLAHALVRRALAALAETARAA